MKTLTLALPPIEEKTRQLIASREPRVSWSPKPIATRGRLVFEKTQPAAIRLADGEGRVDRPPARWRGPARSGADPRRYPRPQPQRRSRLSRDPAGPARWPVSLGVGAQEEGANLIVVDRNGKETTIPSADVDERKLTRLSPMPADFGVVIAEGDLYDLVAFLLAGKHLNGRA